MRLILHNMTFWNLHQLVVTKAIFNLKSEASTNRLSYLWWLIEPVLHMTVYYVVFETLLERGGDDYILFLLTGLIPWLWYSKTVSHCASSLIAGGQLMSQVKVPSVFFPLVYIVQDFVKQIFVFLILLLAIILLKGIDVSVLYIVPVIFVNLLFVILSSLFVSFMVPFFRDVQFIIPSALQALMFFSGVFFSVESLPERFREIFLINPVAFLLKSYRDVLVNNIPPDLYHLSVLCLVFTCILVAICWLFKVTDRMFPRLVLE